MKKSKLTYKVFQNSFYDKDLFSDMAKIADTPDATEVVKQKLLEAYDNLY